MNYPKIVDNNIWIEFPKLKREGHFLASALVGGVSLGCHAGSITGVSINSGMNKWIKSTDPNYVIPYTFNSYSGCYIPPTEEVLKIQKILDERSNEIVGDVFFKKLVDNCNAAIYVLSDAINYKSTARAGGVTFEEKKKSLNSAGRACFEYKTSDFAKYLIKNKIGYVMESPIVQNRNHVTYGNYSLNQLWIWVPEHSLRRAILVEGHHGKEKFPTREEWEKEIGLDFSLASKYVPSVPPNTTIEKLAFDDGRYPDNVKFKEEKSKPA
jgi:hypothetical protein